MLTPHKHAVIIKAWADGHKIQYKDFDDWINDESPVWCEDTEYRVAPTIAKFRRVQRFRLYKHIAGYGNISVQVATDDFFESDSCFHGWVGEWQEVEMI